MVHFGRPFSLPLDRQQFAFALTRGHRRVAVHLREFGDAGVEDILLAACEQSTGYPGYCMDHIVTFALSMLPGHYSEHPYRDAILKRLAQPFVTADNQSHCIALAADLAEQGDQEARILMDAAFARLEFPDEKNTPDHIHNADGTDGFLFVAQTIGERLLVSPDLPLCKWALHDLYFDRVINGDEVATRRVEEASGESIAVRTFLEAIKPENHDLPTCQRRPSPRKLETILQLVYSEAMLPPWEFSGWQGESEEELAVFNRLVEEEATLPLQRLLYIFSRRHFPRLHERFFNLLEHPDGIVRRTTFLGMIGHQDPRIRRAAVDAMERVDTSCMAEAVLVLWKNQEGGDEDLILNALNAASRQLITLCVDVGRVRFWPEELSGSAAEKLYHICGVLGDFVESMKQDARIVNIALWLHEHTPRCYDRRRSLEALAMLDSVPQWLCEELDFMAPGNSSYLDVLTRQRRHLHWLNPQVAEWGRQYELKKFW